MANISPEILSASGGLVEWTKDEKVLVNQLADLLYNHLKTVLQRAEDNSSYYLVFPKVFDDFLIQVLNQPFCKKLDLENSQKDRDYFARIVLDIGLQATQPLLNNSEFQQFATFWTWLTESQGFAAKLGLDLEKLVTHGTSIDVINALLSEVERKDLNDCRFNTVSHKFDLAQHLVSLYQKDLRKQDLLKKINELNAEPTLSAKQQLALSVFLVAYHEKLNQNITRRVKNYTDDYLGPHGIPSDEEINRQLKKELPENPYKPIIKAADLIEQPELLQWLLAKFEETDKKIGSPDPRSKQISAAFTYKINKSSGLADKLGELSKQYTSYSSKADANETDFIQLQKLYRDYIDQLQSSLPKQPLGADCLNNQLKSIVENQNLPVRLRSNLLNGLANRYKQHAKYSQIIKEWQNKLAQQQVKLQEQAKSSRPNSIVFTKSDLNADLSGNDSRYAEAVSSLNTLVNDIFSDKFNLEEDISADFNSQGRPLVVSNRLVKHESTDDSANFVKLKKILSEAGFEHVDKLLVLLSQQGLMSTLNRLAENSLIAYKFVSETERFISHNYYQGKPGYEIVFLTRGQEIESSNYFKDKNRIESKEQSTTLTTGIERWFVSLEDPKNPKLELVEARLTFQTEEAKSYVYQQKQQKLVEQLKSGQKPQSYELRMVAVAEKYLDSKKQSLKPEFDVTSISDDELLVLAGCYDNVFKQMLSHHSHQDSAERLIKSPELLLTLMKVHGVISYSEDVGYQLNKSNPLAKLINTRLKKHNFELADLPVGNFATGEIKLASKKGLPDAWLNYLATLHGSFAGELISKKHAFDKASLVAILGATPQFYPYIYLNRPRKPSVFDYLAHYLLGKPLPNTSASGYQKMDALFFFKLATLEQRRALLREIKPDEKNKKGPLYRGLELQLEQFWQRGNDQILELLSDPQLHKKTRALLLSHTQAARDLFEEKQVKGRTDLSFTQAKQLYVLNELEKHIIDISDNEEYVSHKARVVKRQMANLLNRTYTNIKSGKKGAVDHEAWLQAAATIFTTAAGLSINVKLKSGKTEKRKVVTDETIKQWLEYQIEHANKSQQSRLYLLAALKQKRYQQVAKVECAEKIQALVTKLHTLDSQKYPVVSLLKQEIGVLLGERTHINPSDFDALTKNAVKQGAGLNKEAKTLAINAQNELLELLTDEQNHVVLKRSCRPQLERLLRELNYFDTSGNGETIKQLGIIVERILSGKPLSQASLAEKIERLKNISPPSCNYGKLVAAEIVKGDINDIADAIENDEQFLQQLVLQSDKLSLNRLFSALVSKVSNEQDIQREKEKQIQEIEHGFSSGLSANSPLIEALHGATNKNYQRNYNDKYDRAYDKLLISWLNQLNKTSDLANIILVSESKTKEAESLNSKYVDKHRTPGEHLLTYATGEQPFIEKIFFNASSEAIYAFYSSLNQKAKGLFITSALQLIKTKPYVLNRLCSCENVRLLKLLFLQTHGPYDQAASVTSNKEPVLERAVDIRHEIINRVEPTLLAKLFLAFEVKTFGELIDSRNVERLKEAKVAEKITQFADVATLSALLLLLKTPTLKSSPEFTAYFVEQCKNNKVSERLASYEPNSEQDQKQLQVAKQWLNEQLGVTSDQKVQDKFNEKYTHFHIEEDDAPSRKAENIAKPSTSCKEEVEKEKQDNPTPTIPVKN